MAGKSVGKQRREGPSLLHIEVCTTCYHGGRARVPPSIITELPLM